MKKLFTLLTLALSTLSTVSYSQTRSASVQGFVLDQKQQPLEAVTVSLLHAKDSSVAKILSTDKTGKFNFETIGTGQYLIMVSAVGHQKSFSAPLQINGEATAVTVPSIQLVSDSKELGAVTVTARKPFIEQKIDKMVINVDAAVTNAGSTALEVLEKAPGVSVDKDGNISLKGKQGVMVMMDGRPTYLSAEQLASLLKSMPASSIDQIEIMTNPSAKYDAAGNSGIVNIKTKKEKKKGFNGSVTANYAQGKYWRTNNSFNTNYRNGKFNLFANGGYSKWNSFQVLDIKRTYKDPNSKEVTDIFEQSTFMRNNNDNYNLKIGADFFVTKKTTLGIVLNGNISPEDWTANGISYLMDSQRGLDSIINADNHIKDLWKNGTANLNFRHQFDSTGKELTADLDYVTYRSNNKQDFLNSTFDPDWNLKYNESMKGKLPVEVDIYSAKVDYAQPIKKDMKLETGFKTSFVTTDNIANYSNLVDETYETDFNKSNRFQYKENIMAGYININKQIKKWGIQTGLRYEHTNYEGKQFDNPTKQDSSFSRSYGSLFPTVFVSYAANDKNQFSISVGRRIDRPAYQNLNPFLFFIDKFTYQAGNPYLQPQFTRNVELTHTFNSFLTTTVNYSNTKNLFTETFDQEGYATIVRQGNIGKRQNAGISVSAQVPVQKWWTAILYSNYNYSKFEGHLYGESINVEAGNLMININNQFKFNKGWSAELSGWYRTKGVEGQLVIDPMGAASAGVSKQVIKSKGTVKLNVRDMFYTQVAQGDIKFQSTEAWFRNSRDSRVVNLSFVYRFGKPIQGPSKRKTGGASDELNRVKMGGNN